jgi:imidazoleglycerol-phosphate dehydratase
MAQRKASIKRETAETSVNLAIELDGTGQAEILTGIRMFDHLLTQIARHGAFNLSVSATGDDAHHLVEDVALCLGKAINEALGERRGIVRMADASVPMDESLALVALDLSGRGYSVLDLPFVENDMFGFPSDLVRHFLETLAAEARINLHARVLYGTNDHHKAEAVFKALARALDRATRIDERRPYDIPSSKGSIEGAQ